MILAIIGAIVAIWLGLFVLALVMSFLFEIIPDTIDGIRDGNRKSIHNAEQKQKMEKALEHKQRLERRKSWESW